MARTSLPPGFRFHPTNVELIMYYLKKKVMGKILFKAITELNIYKFGPWELPGKSLLRSKDLEWYFFCPREKKYASGARTNRATENGYWKTTGKDRPVIHKTRTVGMIKTLIFHKGHAPKGERTNWVMHEYRIEDKDLADVGVVQDAYMLCKVFQKNGLGPKNGAQYGAPFNEEEWDDEEEWNDGEEICAESSPVDGQAPSVHVLPSNQNSYAAVSMTIPGSTSSWSISEPGPSTAGPSAIKVPADMADPPDDDIFAMLARFTEDRTMLPIDEEEICAESSPVDGQAPSVHVLPSNQNSYAAVSMTIPGSTSSWSISEPGPSTAGPSAIKVPADMADPPDDIFAMLARFTEDRTMLPIEDNTNERIETVNNHKSIEALVCSDGNAIYNGLGDLSNWAELSEAGLNFSTTKDACYTPNPMRLGDDTAFLELNDLDIPIRYPAEASESQRVRTGSSYAPYTCYSNLEGSYCEGNFSSDVQKISGLNQSLAFPEGSQWLGHNLEVLRKENGIGN